MLILRVVSLMLDCIESARLIGELEQLRMLGLLKGWEVGFADELISLPAGKRLSAKRAAKLLEILHERRKRFHGDGVSVLEMMTLLASLSDYLDESDNKFVADFLSSGLSYVQLHGYNRIHLIAKRLGRDFPEIELQDFGFSREDLAFAVRSVREELKRARAKKRAHARLRPAVQAPKRGRRGCGNDLGPLLQSLGALERAMAR